MAAGGNSAKHALGGWAELPSKVFELAFQIFVPENLLEPRRFQPVQSVERRLRVLHQQLQLEAFFDGFKRVVGYA